jgi:hypothetical protein
MLPFAGPPSRGSVKLEALAALAPVSVPDVARTLLVSLAFNRLGSASGCRLAISLSSLVSPK